jgi:transketolase|uniref:Transketolase-like pyrimidine-binding domain-containing protein n=1 Tax=Anaerolinea thermolimosa TaxID=229919 RepID=A0A7C4KIU4_9CHLR
MRNAFFSELADLMVHDSRIVFITGDLGYKLFDPLADIDPERVINFGIRESAMVGFAAGLAKTGMLPFIYSIVPFITLRCLEQIKIDLCYNRCTAVVVGVGGGLTYGTNGPTHHGVEDVGVLSCLPGLTIWTPCDSQEVRACLRASGDMAQPAYLRLGRGGEPLLHQPDGPLPDIAEPLVYGSVEQGMIISFGHILHEVQQARKLLRQRGLEPAVVHLPTMQPFPQRRVAELLAAGGPVLTVEEHVANGGLGSKVAVVMAESGLSQKLRRLALDRGFPESCMDRQTSLAWAGLDPVAIAAAYQDLAKRN